MADTQWPRFEVFVQEKPGGPRLDAGSVHAPDAEMALLNARDVFARRPEIADMWVAPAAAITSRTLEELRAVVTPDEPPDGPIEGYFVFCKLKTAGAQTLIGEIEAASPLRALTAFAAQPEFVDPQPLAWWVIPKQAVTAGDPADFEAFYAPAADKRFRLSTDFKTHTAMRRVREGESGRG